MASQRNRFYILDLMRFGAAFGVALYHLTARPDSSFELLSQVTRYGYLGVPIFFMLSGFVIAISAKDRSAYQFGVSRFARLYPGLWACIAITMLVVYLTTGMTYELQQVVTNAMLINDYVGQKDIDGVYWTLHAELKFYACIFLLAALGIFHRYHVWLSAWLGLSILHLTTGQPWFMGWFISPGWSPFFIVGVAFYHIHSFGAERFNIAVLGTALIMACLKTYTITDGFIDSAQPFDAMVSTLIFLLFASILGLAAIGRLSVAGGRTVFIAGAITYPVYLLHNRAGKAVIDATDHYLNEWVAVCLAIGAVFLIAYAVHRWIEQPASRAIKRYGQLLPEKLPLLKQSALIKQGN